VVTTLSSIATFWFWSEFWIPIRVVVGVAIVQGIFASMFVMFTALVGTGFGSQRREAARYRASGSTESPPRVVNREALLGLIGTIITAVLAFLGVLFQVLYGGGAGV